MLEVAIEFAGFSPAQAESLRRAMSRKRSQLAIDEHHRAFLLGAQRRWAAPPELAERIWQKIQGFAGFGFPKAHSAAFGLLAYQTAWLRVHHPEAFLCGLLNEQPMGFYPPDALVHEAQRQGVRVARAHVNQSLVDCHVESPRRRGEPEAPGRPTVRLGLAYVKGAQRDEVESLVAERLRGGPFRGIADLASRSGVRLDGLEKLAWAGALDEVPTGAEEERRRALWRVGVTGNSRKTGGSVQLALSIEPAEPPALEPLPELGETVADYRSTGLTLGRHPLAMLRPGLDPTILRSSELSGTPDGTVVEVAGMVVVRQRPGTAKGVVFLLLEDEVGTVNVIVPPPLYDRRRPLIRAAPLLRAKGKLERREGTINVVAADVAALEQTELPALTGNNTSLTRSSSDDELRIPRPRTRELREHAVAQLRAVAPAGHSFGRRG